MNLVYKVDVLKDNSFHNVGDIMNNVFTEHMKINIMDNKKSKTIVFVVNDIVKLTYNKTELMKRIQHNGGSIYKSTRKQKKLKTKKRSKKRSMKMSMKRSKSKMNKIGGGKTTNLILGFIAFFITDFIVEIQWVHHTLDTIPRKEFHNVDIFKYGDEVKTLIEKVDSIDLESNMTDIEIEKQITRMLDTKGQSLSLLDINSRENRNNITERSLNSSVSNTETDTFRPAFVEIDLSNKGPTSKLVDIMEKLPKKIKSYVYFSSETSGYTIPCEWKIENSGEIEVKLLNQTKGKGDTRFRNFPGMKEIDNIVKETYKQHIHIMRRTKLLTEKETMGFGEMVLLNTSPTSTKWFDSSKDVFHQDGMSLNTNQMNDISRSLSVDYVKRQKRMKEKNIKLSRPTEYDSVMTMTYSKGVLDANYRFINNTGNEIDINKTNESGFTRIFDQSRGVHHSAKQFSRLDTNTTARNILVTQIMPNTDGNFYRKKNHYINR